MNSKNVKAWIQALRAPFFTASAMPVVIAAAFALWKNSPVSWHLLPLMLVCTVLLHAGTNTINDYYDFKKGVDKKDSFGSSRVLVDNLMTLSELRLETVILFSLGALLGCVIVMLRGLPALYMGLIGLAGGYVYSAQPGLKYRGLGEISVFILMGPLLVVSAYFVLTGIFSAPIFYISIPVGCLVTAILLANNIRDIGSDEKAGIATSALILGSSKAKKLYTLLLVGAYGATGLFIALKILPLQTLLIFLSLPLAIKNAALMSGPGQATFMDIASAKLHLVFTVLLALSLVFGSKL